MKKLSALAIIFCFVLFSCNDETQQITPDQTQEEYLVSEVKQYPSKLITLEEFSQLQASSSSQGYVHYGLSRIVGEAPNGWEADYNLDDPVPAGYILSGVGLSVTGDNVSLMVIESSYLYSDGTLSSDDRVRTEHGDKANKNWGIEAFIQAPNQHAITGIEVWCSNDKVVKIRLYTRQINSSRRLTGPTYTSTYGNNSSTYEKQIKLEHFPELTQDRYILTGLGVRVESDDFKGLKVYFGEMQ